MIKSAIPVCGAIKKTLKVLILINYLIVNINRKQTYIHILDIGKAMLKATITTIESK